MYGLSRLRMLRNGLTGRPPDGRRYVHVLATRIGIGVYDEAWFDFRLSLFEAVTVPSMKAQSCQDFTWLLVVDQDMPVNARRRLDAAIESMPNVLVEAVEFKTDLKDTVVKIARRAAEGRNADYVVTSRLDDDDAMHVDSFSRLHDEVRWTLRRTSHDLAVFSFNLGCMWLPSKRLGYTRYHDSHSLALSLLEPVIGCRGIYSRPHREIKNQLAPRGAYIKGFDGDEVWWLYATHNLASSDTGDQKRADRIVSHKYGYSLDDRMLTSFGLDPSQIGELAELADPKARKAVLRMWAGSMDYEREIRGLRRKLNEAPESERSHLEGRIAELERQRRASGSGIVDISNE